MSMIRSTMRDWLIIILCLSIAVTVSFAGEEEPAAEKKLSQILQQAEQARKGGDFDSGVKLAEKARELAIIQKKTIVEAESCRILAELWFDKDADKALSYYNEEVRYRKAMNDKSGQSYCYNASGILLKRKALYYDALTNYYKSLRIAETISDTKDQLERTSSAAFNIAAIYDTFHFYHKSIHYYQKSLDCERRLRKRDGESLVLANMAITYRKLKQFEKAVSYARQALAFAEEQGNKEEIIRITNNLGYTFLKVGNLEKALGLHKKALSMVQADHVDEMTPYIYSGLGEIYYKLGRFKEAKKFQRDALKLCKEDDLRMLIYRNLMDVCLKLHDMPNSTEYFSQYKKLLDRYYSPASFAKFETLMNAFEQEKKDKQIQLLKKEKRIQRLWKNMLIMGFAALLIFLLWMISRYRMKQRMNRKLDNLSRHDPLTGLSNRRDVMEKLRLEHARSIRNKNPLSICICDIDLFKSVNDTHGHQAGDAVLIQLAGIFRDSFRETDILGRWGGEEFIFVFPETDSSGAKESVEKLRKRISTTSVRFEEKEIKITLTFGISQCDIEVPIDTCISKADEALYKGKSSGRNCIITT